MNMAHVLSTEAKRGCPFCKNQDVHLIQCHKLVWKVCDKCKRVFLCRDACETFTDPEMKEWLDKHQDRSILDYKTMKFEWIEKKYADYKLLDHPAVY